MSNKENLKNEIISFIKNKTGIKEIDENTNIASPEYKIFDIDAEYIMQSFFKEFKIDYSNFRIEKYFQYPNYSWKSIVLIRLFFEQEKYPIKLPITIKHLIKVAENKKWFDTI